MFMIVLRKPGKIVPTAAGAGTPTYIYNAKARKKEYQPELVQVHQHSSTIYSYRSTILQYEEPVSVFSRPLGSGRYSF